MKRRRSRPSCPSCRSTTTSWCSIRTASRTGPTRIVPDLATEWAWGNDGKDLTFKLRDGVKWHDGKPFTSADVKCTWDMLVGGRGQAAQEPAQVMVVQSQGGDGQRRPRGDLPSQAAAALAADHARRRLLAGLPCHVNAAPDADQADRHRALQVRRVQAERVDQAGEESRLLEEGPALSRRHRVHGSSRAARHRYWPSSPASTTSPSRPRSRHRP